MIMNSTLIHKARRFFRPVFNAMPAAAFALCTSFVVIENLIA